MGGYWTCKQPLRHPLVCTNTKELVSELSTISTAHAGRTDRRGCSARRPAASALAQLAAGPKDDVQNPPTIRRKSLRLTLVIVALAQLVAGAKAPQPAVASLAEAACSGGQRAVRWVGSGHLNTQMVESKLHQHTAVGVKCSDILSGATAHADTPPTPLT